MELKFTAKDFDGPLDLLLHLISKNKLDIKDIEISVLVDQYVAQIEQFKEYDMDIASEFLDMASRLIYLKTVSLLPKSDEAEELKAELLAMKVDVEELKKELEETEDKYFDLQMVDHFTKEQREYDRQLRNTIDELNKKIEALTM